MYLEEGSDTENCMVCGISADYMVWTQSPMPVYCLEHLKESYPDCIVYVFLKDGGKRWLSYGELKERL